MIKSNLIEKTKTEAIVLTENGSKRLNNSKDIKICSHTN
jgi:hypothetical protein